MVMIICKYCHKEFRVKQSRANKAKYCSHQCCASDKSQIANHIKHELSETDKAYIAGFLDGEGTITLSKSRNNSITKKPFYIRPFIIVGNTNEDVIRWLHEITGLGIVYGGTKPFKRYWSRVWRWQVISAQAKALLIDIVPYLKIKRHEAELLISFPNARIEPENYKKQLEILQEIRDINKRSKPKH